MNDQPDNSSKLRDLLSRIVETAESDLTQSPATWGGLMIEARQLLDSEPARPAVVLHMEGGIIQSATTESPVDLFVIDYDGDNSGDDQVIPVDQGDGDTATAYCFFVPMDHDPEYTRGRVEKFRATDGSEC